MNAEHSRITAPLEEKVKLFEKILACAEQQAILDFEHQSGDYNNLWESRRHYMEAIEKLDIMIGNLTGLTCQSPQSNESQAIHEIILRIMAIDKGNQARLQKERVRIKQQLQNLRQGKKGTALYRNFGQISSTGAYTDSRK